MIKKIMSKLGMVVLWSCVIIYGIGVITHICSDIIGVVVLVILAVISIIFVLYAKRYKILFKRRVKMLSRVCEKSPNDSRIMPEEQLPNLLIQPTSLYSTSLRRRSSFSAATITLFFLITLRLGSRRLRRLRHLSPRKPQKQKSK